MANQKLVQLPVAASESGDSSTPIVLLSRPVRANGARVLDTIGDVLTAAGADVVSMDAFRSHIEAVTSDSLVSRAQADASDVALIIIAAAHHSFSKEEFPHALRIGVAGCRSDVDLNFSGRPVEELATVYHYAVNHWAHSRNLESFIRAQQQTIRLQKQQIKQLTDIGIALSAERAPSRLLNRILTEARRLANCEAGSLYLLSDQEDENQRQLVFKLAHNDLITTSFKEKTIPLAASSLAGYVATTGEELVIDDAYSIAADKRYAFNPRFDIENGYRTRSLLVIPMKNYKDKVVGVLQFINRFDEQGQPSFFDAGTIELLRALSSQAAIAIEKNSLIQNINELFERFVQASVKAIEQRDPATSGHSFRVAETTTALLAALPLSGLKRFKHLKVTSEHLKEVRYAALLHDFGKVGVAENVLTKAQKLTDERLEIYRYRIELQKERLRNRALQQEVFELHHHPVDFAQIRRKIQAALHKAMGLLDDYLSAITMANNPTITASGNFEPLREIGLYDFLELDGSRGKLLQQSDLNALSIKKGSLTLEERQQIEDHVVYTRDFLSVLPWPQELAGVPGIAAAHHEKLNGSGYPLGLTGDEIPLPSRVMTVCDIYDALTAMDRPYKSSVSTDTALDILKDEVSQGMLDKDVVDIFVASRIYGVVAANKKESSKVLHAVEV